VSTPANALSVTRAEDYPAWYQAVITQAELSENSPVRGCMVIRPWGYAIWENIQTIFNRMMKETGHQNAYFPLFIPVSFLEREAKHVAGFAKEIAVVTHHRLEANAEGKLVPASPLEEPLVVRPTSETIIGEAFKGWIESYRDLPILINQWANVVRWEMRTRQFLRTTEFLWQEGHTVHATAAEALDETELALDLYVRLAQDYLAMPVIKGEKTEGERFPGAERTLCIEAMMQDRKALQAGTSHFLGQNFARACEIQYLNAEGQLVYGWTTSWGVSTRLIGGMIMTHSDDDGLVLPPKIASAHVVIIPVLRKDSDKEAILRYCEEVQQQLKQLSFAGISVEVILDKKEDSSGNKAWHWVRKGIPIRLEIGSREQAARQVCMGRRDCPPKDKRVLDFDVLCTELPDILLGIQYRLYERALAFREANTQTFDNWEAFESFFTPESAERPEIHGGFAIAHWAGTAEDEEKLKAALGGVTPRCIPLIDGQRNRSKGKCIFTGRPAEYQVIFAKSY
jgi:prolyl-tRNA synthetase